MNCNSRSTEGSIDAQTSQRCFGSLYCIVDWDFHSIMIILWSRREARRSWTFSGIRKSCLKAFLVAFRLCSGPSEILQSQFPRGNPYVHLKESQHKKSTKTLSQHKIWRTPPPTPPPSRYGTTKSQVFLCMVVLWPSISNNFKTFRNVYSLFGAL